MFSIQFYAMNVKQLARFLPQYIKMEKLSDVDVLKLYSYAIIACFLALMANAAWYTYRKKCAHHYFPAVCTIVSGDFRDVAAVEAGLITAATVFVAASVVKQRELGLVTDLQVILVLLAVAAVLYRLGSADHRTGGVSYKFSTCVLVALILGFYCNSLVFLVPLAALLVHFIIQQSRVTKKLKKLKSVRSGYVRASLIQPVLLFFVLGSFVVRNFRIAATIST
jgi:hypothetical protein